MIVVVVVVTGSVVVVVVCTGVVVGVVVTEVVVVVGIVVISVVIVVGVVVIFSDASIEHSSVCIAFTIRIGKDNTIDTTIFVIRDLFIKRPHYTSVA
jgi:hypothetical protein